MSLLSEERKQYIVNQVVHSGKVEVTALSRKFQVSEETIRRDLLSLEAQGKVKRVYGGALKPSFMNIEPPYAKRRQLQAGAKKRIGRRAAELIEDGNTIAIDVGTTTLELAKSINGRQRLTVLTNCLPVASALCESLTAGLFSGKIILLGGEVQPEQLSVTGPLSGNMMKQFRIDKAFLSVGGLSVTDGITDYTMDEAMMSRLFADCAEETVLLADHSKLNVKTFMQIAPIERADAIVCDVPCPKNWTAHIQQSGVRWIHAR